MHISVHRDRRFRHRDRRIRECDRSFRSGDRRASPTTMGMLGIGRPQPHRRWSAGLIERAKDHAAARVDCRAGNWPTERTSSGSCRFQPPLLVVVFALVLDGQDRHRIQCGLIPVQGQVAASAEVDNQLAQVFAIVNGSANHGRMGKRHQSASDVQQGSLGHAGIFADKKRAQAGQVGLGPRRKPYV